MTVTVQVYWVKGDRSGTKRARGELYEKRRHSKESLCSVKQSIQAVLDTFPAVI